MAFIAGIFGALGWLVGGLTTALLFGFCVLLAATGVYRFGDRALLGMLGARPFALAEDPRLRSAVDTVAAKMGVRPPQLYLIDDGFPRLFAVGRGPTSSARPSAAWAASPSRTIMDRTVGRASGRTPSEPDPRSSEPRPTTASRLRTAAWMSCLASARSNDRSPLATADCAAVSPASGPALLRAAGTSFGLRPEP